MNVDEIVNVALDLAGGQREAYLDKTCAGDAELRNSVDELLGAIEAAEKEDFLAAPFLRAKTETPEKDAPSSDGESENARFQIISRHAMGGLGEVWVARDRQLNRNVALKQIQRKWADQTDASERFVQEAGITSYLEHPGVVPIYSMGKLDDGRPFYAMQFIRGRTLRQAIAETLKTQEWYTPEALRNILDRMISVCQTIEYAHSRGVIHRDLKPSNVMLGAYGQTLVVDWGLAKHVGDTNRAVSDSSSGESTSNHDDVSGDGGNQTDASRLQSGEGSVTWPTPDSQRDSTRHGTALGTPRFMSPEQALGDSENIGPATDVYGLGATLYCVLTGQPPHGQTDSDLGTVLSEVSSGKLVAPRKLRHEIPRPLEAITLKAMHRRAGHRYASASALAEDLRRFIADQPIDVFRDSLLVRGLRWTRHHRAFASSLFVAIALSILGLLVGGMVFQEMDRRAWQEEQRQARELDSKRRSASAAHASAETALAESRYSDAARLLSAAIDRLQGESILRDQLDHLTLQRDRLNRVGAFYRLSTQGQDLSFRGEKFEAATLFQQALKEVGFWESDAWWADLPDDDLTPRQRTRLQWDIYRDLLDLASMYVTRMVLELGRSQSGTPSRYQLLRNFIRTSAGIEEAKAAVELTRRIEAFRPSQAAIWLKSIAQFRLRKNRRISAAQLGPPDNVADGETLAMYALIASVDPEYRKWFKDYGRTFLGHHGQFPDEDDPEIDHANDDATIYTDHASMRELITGLETLRRVSDDGSDSYWVRLRLGQVHFMIAQQAAVEGQYRAAKDYYELARNEYGRCIALRPETAFGYADRSTVAHRQADLLTNHPDASPSDRDHAVELLGQSLQDAQTAVRLQPEEHWVYWHLGAIYAELEQTDAAVEAFLNATTLGFNMSDVIDIVLVRLDDVRGRDLAMDFVTRRENVAWETPEASPEVMHDKVRFSALRAALELTRGRIEAAVAAADKAIRADQDAHSDRTWHAPLALAHQVAGWCELKSEAPSKAREHFAVARQLAPDHIWSLVGSAKSSEREGDDSAAVAWLQRAIEVGRSPRQRATAWLELAKVHTRSEKIAEAIDCMHRARNEYIACDLTDLADTGRAEARKWIPIARESKNSAERDSAKNRIESLRPLMKTISDLPGASVNQIIQSAREELPHTLPLLNHGFEMPLGRYWHADQTRVWQSSSRTTIVPPVKRISDAARTGEAGLRFSAERGQVFGDSATDWWTRQSVPTPPESNYSISLVARSTCPTPNSVEVRVTHSEEILARIQVAASSEDWQTHSADFYVPKERGKQPPLQVEIHVRGDLSGTVDLDDLSIELKQLPVEG